MTWVKLLLSKQKHNTELNQRQCTQLYSDLVRPYLQYYIQYEQHIKNTTANQTFKNDTYSSNCPNQKESSRFLCDALERREKKTRMEHILVLPGKPNFVTTTPIWKEECSLSGYGESSLTGSIFWKEVV